ncbi:hypothetical protein BT63DRAFT_159411 [Microthyrium microscopicum]|uniref:Uncharacterized protein n=1 Tax=Microthyrium microscopicum TaxID=703497 RepID=A0A6A6UQ06_9PEZI|nr:hypothetical protein BT63DRAFT_159411 [Microthyrium microscopicum]
MSRPKQGQSSYDGSQPRNHNASPMGHSTSYFTHHYETTPSRIPRPSSKTSPTSVATPTSRRISSGGSSTNILGKRARPISPPADMYNLSPFPPHTPSFATPAGWSHVTAAHIAASPPPMVNTRYTLAGGMDTPSLAAQQRYDVAGLDFVGDGRPSREWQLDRANRSFENGNTGMIRGDRNGRARDTDGDDEMADSTAPAPPTQNTWGKFVLSTLGGVVAGAWALCRKSAFQGFYAGGGRGYELAADDGFASESMWEDEMQDSKHMAGSLASFDRSFDRLPTPVPGEYPDSPPEYEPEYSRRPAKRRQTDGGGWIVVDKKDARSRTSSPHLSTPNRVASHSKTRSVSNKRPPLGSQHRHRLSGVSFAGSPGQVQQHARVTSYGMPASGVPTSPTAGTGQQMSPPSIEAKRFAARKKKEDRVIEEKYDQYNDKLKELIRQGKEALGSKVEIVEEDW